MSASDGDRLYVHANAFAPAEWGYVLGRIEAVRSLQATAGALHLLRPRARARAVPPDGHRQDRRLRAQRPACRSRCRPQRRWLVIPGSAGQPRDGNPAACYATVRHEQRHAHLLPRALRPDAAGAKIRAAGLPQRLASRLERWRLTRQNTHRAPARSRPGDRRLPARGARSPGRHGQPVARHARRAAATPHAADDEGAAHQGRRRPGHHRRLRGRADDHADARAARTCRASSPRATSRASPTS